MNLLQSEAYNQVVERLGRLSPEHKALWGQMDAAQMLAHLGKTFKLIRYQGPAVPRPLIGRILGPLLKKRLFTKGFDKNMPTMKNIKVAAPKNFSEQKELLLKELQAFWAAGEAGITKQPHAFFGPLTPQEWSRLQYLHLDHHLKQFGV
jgi:hypothetical protein